MWGNINFSVEEIPVKHTSLYNTMKLSFPLIIHCYDFARPALLLLDRKAQRKWAPRWYTSPVPLCCVSWIWHKIFLWHFSSYKYISWCLFHAWRLRIRRDKGFINITESPSGLQWVQRASCWGCHFKPTEKREELFVSTINLINEVLEKC